MGFYSGVLIGMFLGMCLGIVTMGLLGTHAEESYKYTERANQMKKNKEI